MCNRRGDVSFKVLHLILLSEYFITRKTGAKKWGGWERRRSLCEQPCAWLIIRYAPHFKTPQSRQPNRRCFILTSWCNNPYWVSKSKLLMFWYFSDGPMFTQSLIRVTFLSSSKGPRSCSLNIAPLLMKYSPFFSLIWLSLCVFVQVYACI